MPTRKSPIVYTGSFNFNFWQYLVKTHVYLNPKDLYAHKYVK